MLCTQDLPISTSVFRWGVFLNFTCAHEYLHKFPHWENICLYFSPWHIFSAANSLLDGKYSIILTPQVCYVALRTVHRQGQKLRHFCCLVWEWQVTVVNSLWLHCWSLIFPTPQSSWVYPLHWKNHQPTNQKNNQKVKENECEKDSERQTSFNKMKKVNFLFLHNFQWNKCRWKDQQKNSFPICFFLTQGFRSQQVQEVKYILGCTIKIFHFESLFTQKQNKANRIINISQISVIPYTSHCARFSSS